MRRPHALSPLLSYPAWQEPRMGGGFSRPNGFHLATPPHLPRSPSSTPALRLSAALEGTKVVGTADPASLLVGSAALPSSAPSSQNGDEPHLPLAALVSSFTTTHSGRRAGEVVEEASLALWLFHLLQLLRRSSLFPSPIAITHCSGVMTMPTPMPSRVPFLQPPQPCSQEKEGFGRLHGEVRVLGDLLRACRFSDRPRPLYVPATSTSAAHPGRGGPPRRTSSRERRAPVQLMATPTDAEEAWLLPLQRDVVKCVLQRLNVMELVCKRLAAQDTCQRCDTSVPLEKASCEEVTAFFLEEVRVVAELVALCGVHERDAQSLTCLIHVLTAAADAGVVISVSRLVEAAAAAVAQHDRWKSDAEGSSVAKTTWCSCVPWLLHCYTTTRFRWPASHLTSLAQAASGDSADSWSTASAWMTAAADRVCATQSVELLQLTQTPSEAWKGSVAAGSGTGASVERGKIARAHTFGLWQSVLDAESANATEAQTYVSDRDGRRNLGRETCESWLREWYAESGIAEVAVECNSDLNGTWHPYWQLVVSGMVRGCARAVDAIVELSEDASVWRRNERSSARSKSNRPQAPASLSSTRTTLEEMQFYAVGSFVCLRRITSSLQRHRRLKPLLQLYAMVSGCVGPCAAVAEAFPSQQRQQRSCENDDGHRSTGGSTHCFSMEAAAELRCRLLSGRLLQEGFMASAFQNGRHRRDHSPPAYLAQRHQAGAMLWREVVLFDAYTLITIGHVSEHAVDGEGLSKKALLHQLAWLQQECALHLTVLGASESDKTGCFASGCHSAESCGNVRGQTAATEGHDIPHIITPARRSVLQQYLTPRTRAGLIAKLREGLRLSAKVLARWGTPEQICALYLRYPSMGPSWEVGRALLQCGHYSVAVRVLESLLSSNAAVRGASASYQSAATSASPPSLFSSSANAVRQLLLEAIEGAAAALVQQCWSIALPTSKASPDTPATYTDDRAAEEEVPLPTELRKRLHSLYALLYSLPVPLPLCLHAVVRGLTLASSDATANVAHGNDGDAALPSTASRGRERRFDTSAHSPPALPSSLPQPCTSAEARTRTAAVLCTYVLRCHLAEKPHEGLLAKTVELWASCVAPYLGRGSSDGGVEASPAPSAMSLELSLADRYLCAVTTRLLYGHPQLPVARLLLSRLVQLGTPPASRTPSDTIGASSTVNGDAVTEVSHVRIARTVVWLLGVLYMLVDASAVGHCATSDTFSPHAGVSRSEGLAYRLCVPLAAAISPVTSITTSGQHTEHASFRPRDRHNPACCRVWNAGFTERYALDTLRLMPRIALEALERLLRSVMLHSAATAVIIPTGCHLRSVQQAGALSGRSVGFLHDRVRVILECRRAAEEEQRHPWQCSTCHLWNSRYARLCKRCNALSTVLLQCRVCGCLTSSADDRDDGGLNCDVCGTALVPPLSSQSSDDVLLSCPPSPDSLFRSSTIHPTHAGELPEGSMAAAGRHLTTAAAAATVTGTGRAACRFTASANIARVLPLRRWTCTHCRSSNDPQHVFFCRVCGQAATDPEKREAAASAAGEVSDANSSGASVRGCACCGQSPRSIEARMLPWCELCGALHQRIRELCEPSGKSCAVSSPTNSTPHSSACATGAGSRALVAAGHHSLYLWWCVECTSALNPWTRTHCELCGAGRPLTSATAAPGVTWMAMSSSPPTSPGFPYLSEKYNAAAPFIAVPWLMQACPSCNARSRVGMPHCWHCQAMLTWPLEVRQALSDGWWWWVTQVTRVVMDGGVEGSPTEDGASPSFTGLDALLHIPRTTRWLCLHDGCMTINVIDGATVDVEGESGTRERPLYYCCAACAFTPRHPPQLLNPFRDRFAWSDAAAQVSPTNTVVVEALLLPPSSPRPGDIVVRKSESVGTLSAASNISSRVRSAESASTAPQSRVQWLYRSLSSCATTNFVCASCGERRVSEIPQTAASPMLPSTTSSLLRLRSLLMVNVCLSCGCCSWGRSSCAFDVPMTSRIPSGDEMRQRRFSYPSPLRYRGNEGNVLENPSPPSLLLLLPGEHAMALRLLLRALAHAVQEGVSMEVPLSIHAASTHTRRCGCGASAVGCSAAAVTVPNRRLDWAWLSRFVFSGVRLITASVSETQPCRSDSDEGSCAPHQQWCSLHERLPWRGCDLASAQQACSAERRMVILESGSHAAGAVHSAIVDVRQVLDGVCALVEHRVKGSVPSLGSSQRRHRGKGNLTDPQFESSAAVPLCVQDAWSRRLLIAALDLLDLVNASTVFDEIGFSTLSRLCLVFRPHKSEHINTETRWAYLQDMKLSRNHVLQGCVRCEQCLTSHGPDQPCAAP
ncbi:hypothetical protein JKF63_03402 [Porcisia hertigi]|uniref:RanBP2-type domain-containing protein n=1 Tax=Porcisia hertigi TaxID=2761500 RepID=A0A836IAJ8_9TRYP|nr:hypothetical protein JKF63_03402 [Porcisia hertigi]